jgi:hypothetical protein
MQHLRWRKSSYSSGQGGNCIEIANLGHDLRAVRDSKHPRGGLLIFPAAEWSQFVTSVCAGKFE